MRRCGLAHRVRRCQDAQIPRTLRVLPPFPKWAIPATRAIGATKTEGLRAWGACGLEGSDGGTICGGGVSPPQGPGRYRGHGIARPYAFGVVFMNGAISSIGNGKMVVELFSEAISVRVWRKRSWSAIGCCPMTAEASD